MKLDRRKFLLTTSAAAVASKVSGGELLAGSSPVHSSHPNLSDPAAESWNALWIWYPGQLAAYRHGRRMHLAVARCAFVGYPGNFRQPVTQAYFRCSGKTDRDIPARWAGPTGRIRVTLGNIGGDITTHHGVLKAGESGIQVSIDFAASLPCLLLEAGDLSTGPHWEASLDGENWIRAESSTSGDPLRLPDASHEIVVTLPVVRTLHPNGPPRAAYSLRPGKDLLLDFEETELGTLRFEASGQGELSIQVGESVAEVSDPDVSAFEQFSLPALPLAEQRADHALAERAFRFARFSATGPAELSAVRFDASMWPAEEKGRFESSDPDLNAIWKTAVATLRSNMHDFYLDGIRRDALLWHDGPLTLEAYERVFFDADLSRQTLIGETMPPHPSIGDLGIIDSPMYDVIGFEREYFLRGDPTFSRMFRDRIEDILHLFISLQDESGFVDAAKVQPYGFFPDWSATKQSGPDPHGVPVYGQMLLAGMFAAAARLAEAWNDDSGKSRYADAAQRLRTSIRSKFWRPESGIFCNGFDKNGNLDRRVTPFAQAFAVVFDIAEAPEFDSIFKFLDDSSKRPAHFSLSQVVELAAYAKAGRASAAVRRLKSAWLPMIQRGYRRFFEDIEPAKGPVEELAMYGRKYAASLCHAWAGAAPVMAVSRGVLGITPVEPGYRVCSVAPQPCGLSWFRGSVPTPHGLIELNYRDAKAEVTLPSGVSARLPNGRTVTGPGRDSFAVG